MKRSRIALLTLLILAGCKAGSGPTSVPEKTIVQKVEDAGISPNDLKHADAAGMQVWLLQHLDVARSIATQCRAAAKDDMAWKTTDEGKICLGEKFANYGEGSSK